MSREILFKGKRLDNGEWIQGNFARTGNGSVNIIPIDEIHLEEDNLGPLVDIHGYEVEEETICQCVNYVGAWEYDIFRCDDELYLIIYSEADLMWEAKSLHSSESIQLGEFNEEEIENVGNLFDNPELVKGTIYEKISKIGI